MGGSKGSLAFSRSGARRVPKASLRQKAVLRSAKEPARSIMGNCEPLLRCGRLNSRPKSEFELTASDRLKRVAPLRAFAQWKKPAKKSSGCNVPLRCSKASPDFALHRVLIGAVVRCSAASIEAASRCDYGATNGPIRSQSAKRARTDWRPAKTAQILRVAPVH